MAGDLIVQGAFDESGDTGTGPRASRYLVVAGIVCPSLDLLRRAVLRTRKAFGKDLRQIPELKAWHMPPQITAKFLARLAALDVEFYAAIVDKHAARPADDPEDWYRLVFTEVVRQALARHTHLVITLDKRYTQPRLRDELTQAIVAGAQTPGTTLSFVHADSWHEHALQAADAVAWGIFQKYEREDDAFYGLIEEKMMGEVVLLR